MARQNLDALLNSRANKVLVNSSEILNAYGGLLAVILELYDKRTFNAMERDEMVWFLTRMVEKLGVLNESDEEEILAAINDTVIIAV